MFVLNPDKYLLPSYRISPFRTADISINYNLPDSDLIDEYFKERFKGYGFKYTYNGRAALNLALSRYQLQSDEIVSVFTTSGNLYISSCVTNEIEKICKWSRNIEESTKIILVIHEFGYPFQRIKELSKHGLPIIEDCAGAFFQRMRMQQSGRLEIILYTAFQRCFLYRLADCWYQKRSHSLKTMPKWTR